MSVVLLLCLVDAAEIVYCRFVMFGVLLLTVFIGFLLYLRDASDIICCLFVRFGGAADSVRSLFVTLKGCC